MIPRAFLDLVNAQKSRDAILIRAAEAPALTALRLAGCACKTPLIGARPSGAWRCRLCNAEEVR